MSFYSRNHAIVVGSYLKGVTKVIGEFYSESDAENFLERNPLEPGETYAIVPYFSSCSDEFQQESDDDF